MLKQSLLMDYFLKNSFLKEKRHWSETWLAIPVEVYSVCVATNDALPSLFSSFIIRLIKTGVSTIDELAMITGFDSELLLYILTNELSTKIRFFGDHIQLIESDLNGMTSYHTAQKMKEFQVLKIHSTGKFIPRPFEKSEDVWHEPSRRNERNFPMFSFQKSKGTPKLNKWPIVLPEVSTRLSDQVVSDLDEISISWRKYLDDYDAGRDYYDEFEIKKYAGKRLSYVKNFHSMNFEQKAYVLTSIIPDEEEEDDWSCSDPFCVFRKRGLPELKEAVKDFCTENKPIVKIINQKINDEVFNKKIPIELEIEGDKELIRYQESQEKVIARYGDQIPETLQRYLVALVSKEQKLISGLPGRKETIAEMLNLMQKAIECLLKSINNDNPWKNIKNRFKKCWPPFSDRKDELVLILEDIGASFDNNYLPLRLSPDSIWRFASSERASLKSLLLVALYSARQYKTHPLCKALREKSSIPTEIVKIADLRNEYGGHANDNDTKFDNKDMEKLVERTCLITELLIRNREI